MIKLLHIAARQPAPRIWIAPFYEALREIGELTVIAQGAAMGEAALAERIRACEVLITGWGSALVPVSIAKEPGELRYICNVSGSVQGFVPLEVIEAGIPVTNWGNEPAGRVAEGAMALTLACLKGLRQRVQVIRAGGWVPEEGLYSGLLEGLNVGVYGYGYIGQRYVEMLRPFEPIVRIYDPYAREVADWCMRVTSLDELFGLSELVAIHAGLTSETRGSVNAALLAKLPEQGIIINTARGAIIDQRALFAELESRRLRAGLDVLDPDALPADHPARGWDNLILTAHDLAKYRPRGGFPPKHLVAHHRVCLENLRRYAAGEPVQFRIDRERYLLST